MDIIQTTSMWMSLIIQAGTVVGLIYALLKFAGTPNETQNERLTKLEAWRDKVDERLEKGDDNFNQTREANRVTQEALLALLSHTIDGNNTEELKQARKNLNDYLIKK